MCLTANRFRPFLITLRKRKVYKVLMKDKQNGKLNTPYTFTAVNTNDLRASGRIEIRRYTIFDKCIYGGMIHSFTDESSATYCAGLWKCDSEFFYPNADYVVYEAIIPPFTLYLKGNNYDIVSRKIKLEKEVYKI